MYSADLIQWLAFGFGTAGSVLWAHNGPWSKYAAAFWLLASLLWVWFARMSGHPALAARDLVGILTTAWGAWRWMAVSSAVSQPPDSLRARTDTGGSGSGPACAGR